MGVALPIARKGVRMGQDLRSAYRAARGAHPGLSLRRVMAEAGTRLGVPVSKGLVQQVLNGSAAARSGPKTAAIAAVLAGYGVGRARGGPVRATPPGRYLAEELALARAERERLSKWEANLRAEAAASARRRARDHAREEVTVPMLTPDVLKYLSLVRQPFGPASLRDHDDIYWYSAAKEAEAALIGAATGQGFLALTGPRGSGKTTLWRAAVRALEARADVLLVKPEYDGKEALTLSHLQEALIQTLEASGVGGGRYAAMPGSNERRARQLQRLLTEHTRAGRAVALLLEESHALPAGTLLGLKRLYEKTATLSSFRPLLAILLFGQDRYFLSRGGRDLSELRLRLQILELPPMNGEVPDYLEWKLRRAMRPGAHPVGAGETAVFTSDAAQLLAKYCQYPLEVDAHAARCCLEARRLRKKPIPAALVAHKADADALEGEA